MRVNGILLIACLSVCLAGMGQVIKFGEKGYNEEKLTVGDYTSVSMAGNFSVMFTDEVAKGEVYVVANEEDMKVILIEVKGGDLQIGTKKKNGFFRGTYPLKKNVKVYISGKGVDKVEMAGSGNISMKDNASAMMLRECHIAGSGEINLEVNTTKLRAGIVGSGSIKLKGKAEEASYGIAGGGDIYAKELKAKKVKAECTGSGDMEVYAIDEFRGNIVGSGDIDVYGTAQTLEKNVMGSGKISKK